MEQQTSDIIYIAGLALGLLSQAAYLKGSFTEQIRQNTKNRDGDRKEFYWVLKEHREENECQHREIRAEIESLKKNVRYKDTCDAMRSGTDKRVDRLERRQNGTASQ